MHSEQLPHHIRQQVCTTREPYRDCKKEKAVKTYTVLDESRVILVLKVPKLNVVNDLIKLFALYGNIDEYRILDNYPCELFQIAVWIKYDLITTARLAKYKLDDHIFYGNQLHVCYAPEYETISDLKFKLENRKMEVKNRIQINAREKINIEKRNQQKDNNSSSKLIPSYINELEGDLVDEIVISDQGKVVADIPTLQEQQTSFNVPYPSMIPDIHHPAIAQAMAASNMSMMKSSLPIRETETNKTMTTSDFTRIMYKRSPEVSAKVTDRLDTLASRGQIVIRNNQTNKTKVDKTFNFVPRQLTDANKKLRKQALHLGKPQGPSKKNQCIIIDNPKDSELFRTIDNIRNKMSKVSD